MKQSALQHTASNALSGPEVLSLLQRYESRNVTFIDPVQAWPIVWERAQGVHVWDADGKRYLDLTAAFGVAAAGHANPAVVRAGQAQMARLLHAMGDVHPHALKAGLARELSRVTFERWSKRRADRNSRSSFHGKTIFCNSGFEAVEAALKTACLATGKHGVVAFEGAYHGLGYGTLNVTHREHFRSPFRSQLGEFGCFLPFPRSSDDLVELEKALRRIPRAREIGAVLVEPVQARGGINVPPEGFLPLLRRWCDQSGALLILDEIYTGFGRTGRWFACEHNRIQPDLICLGKALTGGFPLSACVGRADWMDRAWPASAGEAIHTSTYLGHPVGCAMALAQIREIERRKLPQRSLMLGKTLSCKLQTLRSDFLQIDVRGIGLMAGIELRDANGKPATEPALELIRRMLGAGFILLPEGEFGNILSLTPPLTISAQQLSRTVKMLQRCLDHL